MRNREDTGAAVLFILLGLGYLWAASRYSVGEISNPGPGFMPRLAGIVVLILAAYLSVSSWMDRRAKRIGSAQKEPAAAQRRESVKPIQVTLILIAYLAVMNFLGFPLSTFGAIFFSSRFMGLEGWRKPILLGVGTVVISYHLFVLALDVPLPAGKIWGFVIA